LSRAECSLDKLRALNDYVKIHVSTKPLLDYFKDNLKQFTVNKKEFNFK
jgi:hypothetical protein